VRSKPHHTVISCNMNLNLDGLVEMIWEYLGLVRIFTKKRGAPPQFTEPVVLTVGRYGCTVESVCLQLHKSLVDDFNFSLVWGASVRHQPQRVGLSHTLLDEDVVQIVKKTNAQQKKDKNYGERVQAHYDMVKQKRKGKGKLKT